MTPYPTFADTRVTPATGLSHRHSCLHWPTLPNSLLLPHIKDISACYHALCPSQKYWHQLLDLVRSGKLDPTIIITHELPLEDAPHAYKIFNDKVTHGSGGAERRAGHAGI